MARIRDAVVALAEKVTGKSGLNAGNISSAIDLITANYGVLHGTPNGVLTVSSAADKALTDTSKPFISATFTAASKTLILKQESGSVLFVYNAGENAFTVKNKSTDTGTSLAAGKVALVVASGTDNATLILILN